MIGGSVSTQTEGWQGILDADESIVWQGTPSGKLRLEFNSPFEPLFFLFFMGFSIFWMVKDSNAPGVFWMFGLLFFFVGSYHLVGIHFWKAYRRTRSHLTLTSKRAFIATDVFGKRTIKSYPITRGTVLEFVDGPLGSVFFAKEELKGAENTTLIPVGFELIEDARSVFALFRKVQEGQP